jgi:nucleotide-binding universal stress UspA family protein
MDIHHILVPTDCSADAEPVLQQALVLAAYEHAHMLVLHVLRRCGVMWPEIIGPARARLMHKVQTKVEQRLQTMAAPQPWPIETLAVWGNPATEICRIARDSGSDVIVMSTRLLFSGHSKTLSYGGAMIPTNATIIRKAYDDFAKGDSPAVLSELAKVF